MSYFGVYIPPSKAGFKGNTTQCAGSIAALNIKPPPPVEENSPAAGAGGAGGGAETDNKYEDPEYPPDSPLWLIYTDKAKALNVLRQYKDTARLREFPSRDLAESYVQFGFESIKSLKLFGKATKPMSRPVHIAVSLPINIGPTSNGSATGSSSHSESGTDISSGSSPLPHASHAVPLPVNGERPPFRAPTKQELVEFRKNIEAGEDGCVMQTVWANPRFLISSGDTPTSLKEGCRYNALHICAQVNQAKIAELILKTVSSQNFAQLYAGPKSTDKMCMDLNKSLLDYYLNIPDKGRGETPLHFAVKTGHVQVVEVLISYPQCKSLPNKEGNLPKDIICQRLPSADPALVEKIRVLLNNPYYVPVLRTADNQLPPQIGQPFTPNKPPNLQQKNEDCEGLSVDLTFSALAGPMPREKASSFFRRWKTPPRLGSNVTSPLANSPYISPIKTPGKASLFNRSEGSNGSGSGSGRRVLFSPLAGKSPSLSVDQQNGNHKLSQSINGIDSLEGIEANNNEEKKKGLVENMNISSTPVKRCLPELCRPWSSPALSDYANGSMEMSLLSVSALNDSFRERHIKNSDIEKGLEVVGRQLARQEQVGWREYWDFLNAFLDITSTSGLAQLESFFASKKKSDQSWNFNEINHLLDDIAEKRKISARLGSSPSQSSGSESGASITQVMTPYTCVEKSLQVFAKRITKTLIKNIDNLVSVNDTLLSELKRLKSLIVGFKDDNRFISVDFSKVHPRIAHLVATFVVQSQELNASKFLAMLGEVRQQQGDRREHLECVCSNTLRFLEQTLLVDLPDALKTEELCTAAWEAEEACPCQWEANLSRKTSRRKRTASVRSQTAAAAAAAAPSAPTVPSSAQLRSSTSNNNNNSDEEDEDDGEVAKFFDCCLNEEDEGESSDEVYLTPPESRSPVPVAENVAVRQQKAYDCFIFGKEPTKRDLDVLNAIFHLDIGKEQYPRIHAWREAMESYSTDEMELFPSPKHVQKTHKPVYVSAQAVAHNNCEEAAIVVTAKSSSTSLNSLSWTKYILSASMGSPVRSAPSGPSLNSTPKDLSPPTMNDKESVASADGSAKPMAHKNFLRASKLNFLSSNPSSTLPGTGVVAQAFHTPVGKPTGLFSRYRMQPLDFSPMMNDNSSPKSGSSLEESD